MWRSDLKHDWYVRFEIMLVLVTSYGVLHTYYRFAATQCNTVTLNMFAAVVEGWHES